MTDLSGWTDRLNAGPFRFTPRPPDRPFSHLSDWELQERSRRLSLRLLETWRAGKLDPRAFRLLARVAHVAGVKEHLTAGEREALGVEG